MHIYDPALKRERLQQQEVSAATPGRLRFEQMILPIAPPWRRYSLDNYAAYLQGNPPLCEWQPSNLYAPTSTRRLFECLVFNAYFVTLIRKGA